MPSYEPQFPKDESATEPSAEEREARVAELRRRIAICRNLADSTSSETAKALREIARDAAKDLDRLNGGAAS